MRRRHRQEQADQLQYANSELITKLLPVLDNFHRALDHAPEGVEGPTEQLRSGLLMVVKQFEDILESEGGRPIEAEGQILRSQPAPGSYRGTLRRVRGGPGHRRAAARGTIA